MTGGDLNLLGGRPTDTPLRLCRSSLIAAPHVVNHLFTTGRERGTVNRSTGFDRAVGIPQYQRHMEDIVASVLGSTTPLTSWKTQLPPSPSVLQES